MVGAAGEPLVFATLSSGPALLSQRAGERKEFFFSSLPAGRSDARSAAGAASVAARSLGVGGFPRRPTAISGPLPTPQPPFAAMGERWIRGVAVGGDPLRDLFFWGARAAKDGDAGRAGGAR